MSHGALPKNPGSCTPPSPTILSPAQTPELFTALPSELPAAHLPHALLGAFLHPRWMYGLGSQLIQMQMELGRSFSCQPLSARWPQGLLYETPLSFPFPTNDLNCTHMCCFLGFREATATYQFLSLLFCQNQQGPLTPTDSTHTQ